MSKNRLIPKLRFPEFVNDGEWRSKLISKIGKTVNGLSGKRGSDFGNGNPYVQYKQVFDKSFIDFSECGKVEVAEDEKQNQLQLGDILFTTSSETPDEIGFSSVVINQPKKSTYLNSFCFILRPFDLKEIEPNFSRYLFRSPIYRKSVSTIAQGSTRYNLSKKAFLKLQIPIPQPQEQQKIASCLSSLDEVIEAHSKKLQLLKDHKKGLMQNLFPQEGEKVPKLRFPEFENCGEWEEATLGDISEITTGASNRENSTLDKGKYAFFDRSEDIRTSDRFLFEGEAIIVAGEGQKFIPKYFWGKFDLHQRAYAIMNFTINGKFAFYFILKNNSYFIQYAVGSTVKSLRQSIFEQMPILFPKKKKEQQKIASCLSALDELITAQTEKIEQLQQHKKGLMQGLFPKMES